MAGLDREANVLVYALSEGYFLGAEVEAVTSRLRDQPNVLVYTLSEGYYLGATLKTGHLSPDESANQLFYNTNNRMPELLYSDWVQAPAEAKFLMDYVTRITSQ